jgi:glycosyltransferase involved in cell wall biosynthesis
MNHSSPMPRVLLISYHYPPRPSVGSLRPAGLAKYLPEFGWEPIVLTPTFPGRDIHGTQVWETGYRDVIADWKRRFGLNPQAGLHAQLNLPLSAMPTSSKWYTKIMDFAWVCLTYPDANKGWTPFALEAISEFNRSQRAHAIISTGPPSSCHVIARKAKSMLGCPWIADFRDLWVQNLAATNAGIALRMQGGLEKRTLRTADALVTVSEPWAERLRERYPDKPSYAIANGFDPDDFASPPPPLTRTFSITYTGQLYQGKRDPSPLFEVLQQLFQNGTVDRGDVRVRFYGPIEPWLLAIVQRYSLQDVVEMPGKVSREEALLRQRESQLLLQLGWSDPRETGQYTGKLFEYLGSRRPILAVGGARGVMTELLAKTGAGLHALSRAELREFLVSAYAQYRSGGFVPFGASEADVKPYTHREMAHKMSVVLTTICGVTTVTAPPQGVAKSKEAAVVLSSSSCL